MENSDGFMGSLAVGVLSQGLRKETDIALVVGHLLSSFLIAVEWLTAI